MIERGTHLQAKIPLVQHCAAISAIAEFLLYQITAICKEQLMTVVLIMSIYSILYH